MTEQTAVTQDQLLVLLRGTLLDAHATPLVLTVTDQQPSITLSVPAGADASTACERGCQPDSSCRPPSAWRLPTLP